MRIAAITRGLRRPWMTATTQKGHFCRRISNQIFTYQDEPERPRSQVRAFVAPIGKSNRGANPAKDFLSHTTGCNRIIFRNVFLNPGDILCRKRMKAKVPLRGHRDG